MRSTSILTLIFALGAAGSLYSQSSAQPQTVAGKGTVQRILVRGKSLDGNLAGESPYRDVSIYLPPSYESNRARRFPVVYLLHGYSGTDLTWLGPQRHQAHEALDRAVAAGTSKEMILVAPNANSAYLGSMYSNSATAGDWETFIAEDLVSYIDANFRTVRNRRGRGLAGHSMGGYGALRIAMKRPDVFSSVYLQSACCLGASVNPDPARFASAEAIKSKEDLAAAGRGPMGSLARAAAWSPNPANPPLYIDLPAKDGALQQGAVARWAANAPLAMVPQYVTQLKKLHALAFDIGEQDQAVNPETNARLHEMLTGFKVPHTYETYQGDHGNKIAERTESKVLPFFSQQLEFPVVRPPFGE